MSDVYFWCDLETTGLDPSDCEITELAVIITKGPDTGFEEVVRYHSIIRPEYADRQTWEIGALRMAEKSGLYQEIAANKGLYIERVSREIGQSIAQFKRPILAARNVAFERGFLEAHAERIADRLHYRSFDVTPLCLIDPTLYDYEHGIEGNPHRAMYDIERDLEYAREFVRRYGNTSPEIKTDAEILEGGVAGGDLI